MSLQRVLAQRARRLRERTQRQQQLPSPDPTQVGRVLETFQLRPVSRTYSPAILFISL